jgi:hypothetical protein
LRFGLNIASFLIVSRPAFAAITAIYGSVRAPVKAIHLYGLGSTTVNIKQAVLIIIETKYLRCLADWSAVKPDCADVID